MFSPSFPGILWVQWGYKILIFLVFFRAFFQKTMKGRTGPFYANKAKTEMHRFCLEGPLNGGGGGFPIWTCPSFFVPLWDFPDFSGIFPICPGTLRGFSRSVLFLFLGLLTAPTRNSYERVRDTIRTFPEKKGENPPRFGNPPV